MNEDLARLGHPIGPDFFYRVKMFFERTRQQKWTRREVLRKLQELEIEEWRLAVDAPSSSGSLADLRGFHRKF